MKKSRAITLTVLGGLTLTGGAVGCGQNADPPPAPRLTAADERYETPDRTWHDPEGNVVPERWRADDQGNHVLDDQGRPIPEPGVPHDRYGRPWVFVGGLWGPLPVPLGRPPARVVTPRSGVWLTGGSGYRTTGTAPTYRAPTGFGSAPLRSAPSAGVSSSVTRGGFGTTGGGLGGSSSS